MPCYHAPQVALHYALVLRVLALPRILNEEGEEAASWTPEEEDTWDAPSDAKKQEDDGDGGYVTIFLFVCIIVTARRFYAHYRGQFEQRGVQGIFQAERRRTSTRPFNMQTVQVRLPNDAEPGQTLTLTADSGHLVQITVPIGHFPGGVLDVEIPRDPSDDGDSDDGSRRRSRSGDALQRSSTAERLMSAVSLAPADIDDQELFWIKIIWGSTCWLVFWVLLLICIGRAMSTPAERGVYGISR